MTVYHPTRPNAPPIPNDRLGAIPLNKSSFEVIAGQESAIAATPGERRVASGR
jgi:hypothetical protein